MRPIGKLSRKNKFYLIAIVLLFIIGTFIGVFEEKNTDTANFPVEYGAPYYSTEEVALHLYYYQELPVNYITKTEAQNIGWNSKEGNLWVVAEGACIGGDIFGNREGLLPSAKDRSWYECDVNYEGGYRNDERIVFSTDGLIYYTGDHYESFDQLYNGWNDPEYWEFSTEYRKEIGYNFSGLGFIE